MTESPKPQEPQRASETHEHDGHESLFDPTPHTPKNRTVAIVVALVALGVVALFLVGYLPKIHRERALTKSASTAAGAPEPVVSAIAQRMPATGDVTLPGTIQPLQETIVYARTSGYLSKWLVDIGDSVKEGQLLAEIETPELDQELQQARAAAEQAHALIAQATTKLELARTVLERAKNLAQNGLANQAELDQDVANVHAEEANVQAAKANADAANANVARLLETKKFAKVVAPFDGTITARTTEVGALVTSATSALFKLSATKVVRVFVYVPQLYAPTVSVGTETTITVREFPERAFKGTVTRTAKALDPTAHTLLTEVHVDNADGALFPGTYAQVKLATSRSSSPIVIPATALSVGQEGTRVAVIKDGVVHWQTIAIEDDLGDKVTIGTGLDEGSAVVLSPSDKLAEGEHVVGAK